MNTFWLLFNTSLCKWIVNMCYIFKFKNQSKQKEYRIEFDEIQRYLIVFNKHYANENYYNVKILKNDKLIAIIEFENPVQFCEKLKADTSPSVVQFVDLILFVAGFRF